jgi:prephenate dehydrogenase
MGAADMTRRVAILGLGLMGGSLGLSLRALLESPPEVAGYDVDPQVRQRALEHGAITRAYASPEETVEDADLVVFAVPVLAMADLMSRVAPALSRHAILMDLGSTKEQVLAWVEQMPTLASRFVGGHPMAGSERQGIEGARADLYVGSVWCLTPSRQTDADALERALALVTRLGAKPLVLDAAWHDDLVASVSHLPLVAAAALVRIVANDPERMVLAASGFRDTTRVASGSPEMARDICLSNRVALIRWLDTYISELNQFRSLINLADPEIVRLFEDAQAKRDNWLR